MKDRNDLICPNCFGAEHRKELATATSRNVVRDGAATDPDRHIRPVLSDREGTLHKMFCSRCGHEIKRGGNRV